MWDRICRFKSRALQGVYDGLCVEEDLSAAIEPYRRRPLGVRVSSISDPRPSLPRTDIRDAKNSRRDGRSNRPVHGPKTLRTEKAVDDDDAGRVQTTQAGIMNQLHR